jgi:hypothetical protein
VPDAQHRRRPRSTRTSAPRDLGNEFDRLERAAHVMVMISSSASRQSRLTSAGRLRAARRPAGPREPDQRLAHRGCSGPAAPRAGRADGAAPVGIPAERDLRARRPRTPAAAHARSVQHGPEPRSRSRPISNTRRRSALAPSPSSSRRNAAASRRPPARPAGRAQLADQLRRVRGVGHARHVGTKRGVALGRVEALQRRQLGARPLADRRCPERAQRQAAREADAGSCARRAPAPTAARYRGRTA